MLDTQRADNIAHMSARVAMCIAPIATNTTRALIRCPVTHLVAKARPLGKRIRQVELCLLCGVGKKTSKRFWSLLRCERKHENVEEETRGHLYIARTTVKIGQVLAFRYHALHVSDERFHHCVHLIIKRDVPHQTPRPVAGAFVECKPNDP